MIFMSRIVRVVISKELYDLIDATGKKMRAELNSKRSTAKRPITFIDASKRLANEINRGVL